MRSIHRTEFLVLAALAVTASLVWTGAARAQESGRSTYRVILYIVEDGAPRDVSLKRLDEVWTESEGVDRLRSLLAASRVQQLEGVTIQPGRDTPSLRLGNVTVRVRGAYREPRRDAMFLRVEMDGGQEALVKEMVSKFDETIVLAYPLTEGNRSMVALIIPTGEM